MAAIAAAAVATITTSHLTKFSYLSLSIDRISLRTLSPRLCASLNSTPSIDGFDFTFSPKLPEPRNHSGIGFHLFLPRIFQGRAIHALPVARSLHVVAGAGAGAPPTKGKRKVIVEEVKKKKKSVEELPRYSNAARRFYNGRFREQPQRLAKVLAAAGVASRRSSEELIFQGKVTVNGSVCNTPQVHCST